MRALFCGSLAIAATTVVVACGDGFGPRREITLNFCSPVAAVAVLADNGNWVRVGSGTRVTFPASPRVAIAIAYPVSNILILYYASAEEVVKEYSCPTDPGNPNFKTVNVSVRGLGANEFGMLAMPGGETHVHLPADFPLCCLPLEPVDIVVWKQYEPTNAFPTVPRIIFRRALNPENNSTLPVFDFASAEAFTPATRTLTLIAAPPGPIFAQTDFRLASGATLMVSADSTSGTSMVHHVVPAERMAADDMHVIRLGASSRDATLFFHTPSDRSLTFGPAMIQPTFTQVDSRLHVEVPIQPEYDKLFSLFLYDDANTTISLTASSEYLESGSAHWSFTVPDLSHIPEFGTLSTISGGFVWSAYVTSMPLGFRTPEAQDGDFFRKGWTFGSTQGALARR